MTEDIIAVECTETQVNGICFRLFIFSTHYRKPINFCRKTSMDNAVQTLKSWITVIEPSNDAVPDEIIAALNDDLNTPLAITHMHRYCKKKQGRKLYAAMRILGLLPRQLVI